MLSKKEKLQALLDLKNPELKLQRILADQTLAEAILDMDKIPGPQGEPGKDGETPSDEHLVSLIEPLIPEPIQGEQGPVGPEGPEGPRGYSPIREIDYWTKEDRQKIIKDIEKLIPKSKDGVSPKIEDIVAELQKRPVEYKDIKGAPDLSDTKKLVDFLKAGGFRGGGLSSVSTDSTLTGNGTPSSPLHVVGGSPLTTKGDLYGFSTVDARIPVGTDGKVLTADSTATKGVSWQVPQIGGKFTYYWTPTASDVVTLYKQTDTPYPTSADAVFTAVTNGQNIRNYITEPNNPGLAFIEAGEYRLHIHAKVTTTAGKKDTYLRGEIWETNSAGAEIVKLADVGPSVILTATAAEYIIAYSSSQIDLSSTSSRIKTKIFSVTSGGGGAPDIHILVGDGTDSNTAFPAVTVSVNNYVPYTGATKDVDLGTHSLSANTVKIIQTGTSASIAGNTTGNARGTSAFDHQSSRSNVAQVASGACSSASGLLNTSSGAGSQSFGYSNTASGVYSSAVGVDNTASGNSSSAIGVSNTASNYSSSAVGNGNTSADSYASAFGYNNTASGYNSSALGNSNTASGYKSSAVGRSNTASSTDASAVGYSNTASSYYSSAFGYGNTASGYRSFASGFCNTASGCKSSASGYINVASGYKSFASGYCNSALGSFSSASGEYNVSCEQNAAFGYNNTAVQYGDSAFGMYNTASGYESSAVGFSNTASGCKSSASGHINVASGYKSFASGFCNTASSDDSSAIGDSNTASSNYSSAVGSYNTASGYKSSALGYGNNASSSYSSSLGYYNTASGYYSSAVGYGNNASSSYSSAIGINNGASSCWSSAFGAANSAYGVYSSAFGYSNNACGSYSSASGYGNTASGYRSSAFGYCLNNSISCSTELGYTDSAKIQIDASYLNLITSCGYSLNGIPGVTGALTDGAGLAICVGGTPVCATGGIVTY